MKKINKREILVNSKLILRKNSFIVDKRMNKIDATHLLFRAYGIRLASHPAMIQNKNRVKEYLL